MGIEQEFGVTLERAGGVLRIVVTGELDIATMPLLLEHLESDGVTDGADMVVLDLVGVTFIGSSGLRALLVARDAIGGRLQIIPGKATEHLFDIVGTVDLPLIDPDQAGR